MKQRLPSLVSTVFVASVLAAGTALAATNTTSGTPDPSIIAMNQKMKGDSVTITYAFLPGDGTLDIYAVNSSGKIDAKPLGTVDLKAGDHRNVKVNLSAPPREGTRLEAVFDTSGQPIKNSGDVPERTFSVL